MARILDACTLAFYCWPRLWMLITVILLAYSWVPSENEANWMVFLNFLKDAILDLCRPGVVFISDQEKGLTDGVPEVFPHGHPAYCTWHLGENVQRHYGKEMRHLFEALPYAVTPTIYEQQLQRIEEKNQPAANYIRRTANPKYYSRAFFPARRWGHETSQQAESSIKALKPQRQEVTLNMSCQIWDYMMVKFFEKRELANRITSPFPPNIMSALNEVEEKAALLIAHPSHDAEVRITDEENRQYIVQLVTSWSCSCGELQNTLMPCLHAWRAMTRLHKHHYDYVSPYYNTETWQKTYKSHLPALVRDGLIPDPWCGPPLKKRRKGCPTERLRICFDDEEVCRLPRKCGVCGARGHDRRNCPDRQQARKTAKEAQSSLPDSRMPLDLEDGEDAAVHDEEEPTHTICEWGSQESIRMCNFTELLASMESMP